MAGTRPGTRPGDLTRPGRPGDDNLPGRPGAGDGNRPGRPGDGNRPGRPGEGNRPGRPGDNGWANRPGRPGWNDTIHNRPGWSNINNGTINNIHNNWNSVINRPGNNWGRPRPDWINDRNRWGNNVRNNWNHHHWHNDWFRNNWWNGRWNNWHGWHYGYGWGNHNWNYWWTIPTWGALNNWFVWGTPGAAYWQEPIYYDYGPGGNVTFQDNSVYIAGQQIASTADFAMSAAELATVPPPATEEEAEAAEWMPLGTFALSTNEKETDPSRILQLAVDRQGVVSGTLYNTTTDQTQAIQGQVDKETQRVAFRIGDNENIVAETGLYNLTQPEAQLLVHYGTERTETFLLVRLDAPADDGTDATTPPQQ